MKPAVTRALLTVSLGWMALSVWWPLWFLFFGALTPADELAATIGPALHDGAAQAVRWQLLPSWPTLQPMVELLLDTPAFFAMFWNSCIQVFPQLLGQLIFCTPAAWALSRLRFRGRRICMNLYMILMLLPFQVTMVPNYLVLNKLGLLDTHWALILPGCFSAFTVFIMARGFDAVPMVLLEAAALDGAGPFRTFWHVGLPLGMPGILSAMVLAFLEGWNAIEQPMTFLKDPSRWPLSLYLASFNDANGQTLATAMAASLIMLAPAVLIFRFGQQYLELGMPHYLQYRLAETESLLRLFLLDVPTRILYLEFSADGQLTFCAASNRVPQLLRSALWNTREPTILTSGTLTAAGDFDHTEQLLGLAAYAPLRHFRAESPFNYRKKCLLYIPARRAAAVPENQYLADKIVQLVSTCHGHALVLFTSYRQMRNVYDALGGRLMFPVFQAGRGQNRSIQQFKQSGNGVLFAAGSCWEGIDFPSDMVSLLIIAKLPFPIPDPVSDYERQQSPNLRDYISAEVIPEMQKKLRQGFGRAIRTEQDSCVVAILDERAGIGGRYHDAALAALPTCPITEKIEDVQQFIREQKSPDYFL